MNTMSAFATPATAFVSHRKSARLDVATYDELAGGYSLACLLDEQPAVGREGLLGFIIGCSSQYFRDCNSTGEQR
jgi:hypothetical protein